MEDIFVKKIFKILTSAYFSFWASMLFVRDANAYIDPSTTAMLTQIIAGIFISLGLTIGIFRRKIIMFFQKIHVKILQKKIERGKL